MEYLSELKLKASLADAIQNWIDAKCEDTEWRDECPLLCHDSLAMDMATSAYAVLNACLNVQVAYRDEHKLED